MSFSWPELAGRTALVTGGSQGIGLACARALAANGVRVFVTGTRGSAADYADDLSGLSYLQADFSRPGVAPGLVEATGALDILVNNAGTGARDEYSPEGFRRVIEVNLSSVMDMCLAAHPGLKEKGGAIVNMGSLSSFLALRETPAYTASKAGLLGLTRALADKWAPDNIRVNMVAPGFIRTRMTEMQRSDPDNEKRLLRAVPQRRWGEPEEVAQTVLFLASPRAPYVTGQSVAIDGGLMLR